MPAESGTSELWSTTDIYQEVLEGIRGNSLEGQPGVRELIEETLPALARHFDGQALESLVQANPWLAVFRPASRLGWGEAQTSFFNDGPAFLDALAIFTELTRLESMIGVMLVDRTDFATQLLVVINMKMKEDDEEAGLETVDTLMDRHVGHLSDEVLAVANAGGITKTRIEALLRGSLEAVDMTSSTGGTPYYKRNLIYRSIFDVLWSFRFEASEGFGDLDLDLEHPNIDGMISMFRDYVLQLKDLMYGAAQSDFFVRFSKNVQAFVRQVGCAKIHDEPEQNIAELRLFHSTTIGYFAKLQDQYLQKELEVKKLRHAITALEFRYLLENLPDIKLDPNAGPRWTKFWNNALIDEDDNDFNKRARLPRHALKDLVDKRNPKRAVMDKAGKRTIHSEGQNGFLNTTGKTMYSTLSDEIHRYRGQAYEVGDDDGWTEVVTDVLRALKPLDANIDAATHQVDWAKERLRYAK